MKTSRTLVLWPALIALMGLFAIACGSSSSSSSSKTTPASSSSSSSSSSYGSSASTPAAAAAAAPTTAPTTAPTAAAPAAATSSLLIGDSSLGKVLTDPKGLTLYTFTKDVANSGASTVSGGVLASWPALKLTSAAPVKPAGLTGDLATITRDDGSKQVTYKGLPLYTFVGDKKAGDVTGQNVGGFVVAMP